MKMYKKGKREIQTEGTMLANGILLRMEDVREEEPRILTLLLKGFLVYLIVMGEIGCILTSLDITCVWLVIHIGVLAGSVFCALLYYSQKWQNIGYLLLLFAMLASAVWLRRYISSGVFAVVNELTRRAAIFFGNSARKGYVEQIADRSITIPVAMCYVGWVAAILMNVMISRHMRYMAAGFLCMFFLFIPLYLEREPDLLYILMLSAGLLLVLIVRGSGHFGLSMQNQRYLYRPGKQRRRKLFGYRKYCGSQTAIRYIYASRTMFHMVVTVIAFSFILICLLGVFLPKTDYNRMRSTSAMKAGTMDFMENITLLGIMGLFNRYSSTGGLSGGVLGGISAIQLDYETDLTVTYAPYSMERLYLKSFTGAVYVPRQNRWDGPADQEDALADQTEATWRKYKELYVLDVEGAAWGHMKITNTAVPNNLFLPYYSPDRDQKIALGDTDELDFYMYHGDKIFYVDGYLRADEYWDVPQENREVIRQFCEEAGLKQEDGIDETVKKLRDYFQKNYPYTIRPGATPFREDFVNYFLTENRKGYCAHFASAAVLIFRSLGMPARYVEGYVIDPTDVTMDGTVLAGEKYEDYYDGYAPLGETTVVSVDVTDASAHAWVEVYDWSRGWRVVDVTPASMEQDRSGGGLLQQFLDFLIQDAGDGDIPISGAGQSESDWELGSDRLASLGPYAGITLVGLAAAFLLVFLVRWMVRRMTWYHKYRNANDSDRLILCYHHYIQRQCRQDKRLAEKMNYREQLQWLVRQGVWRPEEAEFDKAVDILARAGFSSTPISKQELTWMLETFIKVRRQERRQGKRRFL